MPHLVPKNAVFYDFSITPADTRNSSSTFYVGYVPSATNLVLGTQLQNADINYAAAWLESFYKSNVGVPIYLKVVSSEIDPDAAVGSVPSDSNFKTAQTGSKVYTVFMTGFSKTIVNRTKVSDYVNMNIEFTEI